MKLQKHRISVFTRHVLLLESFFSNAPYRECVLGSEMVYLQLIL